MASINLSRSLAFWLYWGSFVTECTGTSSLMEISTQERIGSELEFKICFILLFQYAALSLLETDFISKSINDPAATFISSLFSSDGREYFLFL